MKVNLFMKLLKFMKNKCNQYKKAIQYMRFMKPISLFMKKLFKSATLFMKLYKKVTLSMKSLMKAILFMKSHKKVIQCMK